MHTSSPSVSEKHDNGNKTTDRQNPTRRRYAMVGTGSRAHFFMDPIADTFRDQAELVAICDVSQVHMDYHCNRLNKEFGCPKPKTYLAEDFDRMLDEMRPDAVLVCTVDAFHHEYLIRAVNKGYDVVTEKPITIDDEKCRAILSAPGTQKQNIRVIFNVRWIPLATKIKELIMAGKIGNVTQVHYEHLINYVHGGKYMGRWHSNKANSGGLLVHKSTHHFDLANWLVDSIPDQVCAFGGLSYFGRENAIKRGQGAWTKYDRYTGKATSDDPFFQDLTTDDRGTNLYMAAEKETGYIYDKNVFREGIDIEDTLSVIAHYRNGAVLSYSLNAYSPVSGYRINVAGDAGRLEAIDITYPKDAQGVQPEPLQKLIYTPLFGSSEEVNIQTLGGGHGGSDPQLQEQMFSLHPLKDRFERNAGHEQGIASAILGIAGNHSLAEGKSIRISDLVTLRPDAVSLHELK